MGGNFASQKEKKESLTWSNVLEFMGGGEYLADLLEHLRKKLDRYKTKSANW